MTSSRPSDFGPGDQRPVAGDLVVLDGLRRADDRGIQHFLVGHLARNLVGLADETVDRRAFHALRPFAELLEDLIEARDLILGLLEMILQALGEIAVRRLVDQT